MLGIRPDAPRGRLYVDPALPDWLPDVALIDLRLGRKTLDIRFWRDGPETRFEVTRGDTGCVVLKPISDGLELESHLVGGA
jgi:hypothetical protein